MAGLLLAPRPARAYPDYGAQIPNLTAAGGCNGLCHATGFLDSPLYKDFAAAGFTWNPTFASDDSDGDGFSNGWELQNPAGDWVSTDPDPGDDTLVSNPAFDTSLPPLPVAVVPSMLMHSEAAGTNGSESIEVQNVGGVPFDYTVLADQTWMAPDPAAGLDLPPAMADIVDVLFMTDALGGGYNGNLTVTIPGIRADRIPQIPVSLTVPEAGALAAQATALLVLGAVARCRRTPRA